MKPYKYQPTSRKCLMSYCQLVSSADEGRVSPQDSRNLIEEPPADIYTLEIPDNSLLSRQFEQNHPRLYQWLNTDLGRKYLEQQRGEA